MNRENIHALKPLHTVTEDDRLGIIRVAVSGFFDKQDLEKHFAAKRQIVDRWRAHGRDICMLIDAVGLKPHSPENQRFAEEAVARLYRSSDRVAMLLESSLVKMQMRRSLSHGDIANFFLSENAAITWLTAHSGSTGYSLSAAWQTGPSAVHSRLSPL
jgi:hypothetical protein